MAEQIEDNAAAVPSTARARRGILRRLIAGIGLFLLAAIALAWFLREEIADSVIRDQLDRLGLAATYEIESVGPRRQVLTNVVVGDPTHPDLTIERVETSLVPRFPFATIGRIRLVRPRLYGTYIGGKLSFGALDPLLFEQPPQEPFAFPDMDLLLEDGRALIEGDAGAVGIKAAGSGNLRDGFSGVIAAVAPRLDHSGCTAEGASLYGTVAIDAERPQFEGPLRLAALDCGDLDLAAKDVVLALDTRLDRGLDGFEGEAQLSGGALAYAGNRARALDASLRYSWRAAALTASYEIGLEAVDTPQLALASLALEGSARTREGLGRIEVEAEAEGTGLAPGPMVEDALASAADAGAGTLAAPLIEKFRAALARQGRGSRFSAGLTLRRSEDGISLSIPEARWHGGSGETLLALSRFQLALGESGTPQFSGNFVTGGPGLPRISGRMESAGDAVFRMRMAEYSSGASRLELPEFELRSSRSGGYAFSGQVLASGPLPGGAVEDLVLPVEGNWSGGSVLSLWSECLDARFERLELGNLELARRGLRLCPAEGGGPILRSADGGMVVAARAPGLAFEGTVGGTPVAIRTGPIALNYPGASLARDVAVDLGAVDAPSRFSVSELTLDAGEEIGGRFSGSDTLLAAVPLDVIDAEGSWRMVNGGLRLDNARFTLVDREKDRRFEPLVARGARLALSANRITAAADLREPRSDRVVTRAEIVHDLSTGTGHADLTVSSLHFDKQLQPDAITGLSQGVVANVFGTVAGKGRIDWSAESLSSTGSFTTDRLDFAAAFGPVEGVSGTIAFTDLLGMVTAPEQVLTIHSFNPGIEVEEGHLTYELRPDYEMVIHGGVWPFLGGSLILEPTTTVLTSEDTRRYTLRLIAVDAAQFVERMELANIAATGRFDGRVPLVFDQDGGRLENGYLVSRPPGGNLSYIGALTYEEMNPIAEFAFDALRSLDFTRMEIELNGPLVGEIVTKVRFDGIRQGTDARRNIITRQIARLPVRFIVNIRAPFYKLITSIQTMYDPEFVADPRQMGLLDDEGRPEEQVVVPPSAAIRPEDLPGDEREDDSGIQTPDSEDAP